MISLNMSKSFEDIAKEVGDDLDRIKNGVMDEVYASVRDKTPVDTGTAKAGWEIHGNEVKNEVPYIGFLETGTVHMRPVGMVSTTLLEVDGIIASQINK